MEEQQAYRPARLSAEQLERVRRLERELGVVLVAYQREAQPPAREPRAGEPPAPQR